MKKVIKELTDVGSLLDFLIENKIQRDVSIALSHEDESIPYDKDATYGIEAQFQELPKPVPGKREFSGTVKLLILHGGKLTK